MADKNRNRDEGQTGVITKTAPKTKKPSLYKVLLLNDDFTPMEFVVHVLERFFNKSREEATRIMLHVHQKGIGVCGVYTLRSRGDQGRPGHGICPPAPASATMHHGKGLESRVPTFSRSLEQALHRALSMASERNHELATLEHLLLALIDDRDAAAVMRACNVDLDLLRRNLEQYIDNELAELVASNEEGSKPTAGFQRVIQRAVIHVQSSGREEVTGANVLVAIFAERESHAAFFLQEQDMTRYDAVNFISHGIAKRHGASDARPVRGVEEDAPEEPSARAVQEARRIGARCLLRQSQQEG